MLCEGLVQTQDEDISQINLEPGYFYRIGVPGHIGNTLHTRDTTKKQMTNRQQIQKW